MDAMSLEQVVRTIDRRLDRVEQILPTLATRDDIHPAIREAVAPLATRQQMHVAIREAVAPLATKEELRAAVAPLATKKELREAVAPLATKEELRAAVAPLATKEELRAAVAPLATKTEMDTLERKLTDQIEQSRVHSRALFENLKDDIRLLAEGVVNVQTTLDEMIRPMLGNHERRIAVLETGRGPAPARRRR
jgi:hypothetical protein